MTVTTVSKDELEALLWTATVADQARLEGIGWVIDWLRSGRALAAALSERGAQ